MLHIHYFAWVRERMGKTHETIPLPDGVQTIADLAAHLATRDPQGAQAFATPTQIRAARNQDFAPPNTPIQDNDEIAFFPPVTGG